MTRYRVATFARYAELLGSQAVEVDLPDGATTDDLLVALRTLPGGDALPPQPLLAVNRELAASARPLEADDELALLPPLAGG